MIQSNAQTRQIMDIVIQNIKDVAEEQQIEIPSELTPDTELFGKQGLFDSLGLVSLVVAVEQSLEDEFSCPVSLADEKAMSQKKSPYRTIESLVIYAHGLILEEQK